MPLAWRLERMGILREEKNKDRFVGWQSDSTTVDVADHSS